MTSRYLVALLLVSALFLLAADPWASKDPAQWTDKDVQQVLTKSPWAKEVSAKFNSERMGRMGGGGMGGPGMGGRGGGMGGPGMGGGMGGPGMGGPGMGGPGMGRGGGMGEGGPGEMSAPKMTVRWTSAAPMMEAVAKGKSGLDAKQVAEWSKEFYVVAVSGFRMMGRGRGNESDRQPDPERMQQMQERMRERMKQATALKVKGKDPIAPDRIETVEADEGRITVFLFPRARSIDADDKEVSFETAMGPLEVKTKFALKDMMYHGKLAL